MGPRPPICVSFIILGLFAALCLLANPMAFGFIDRKFTPLDLVRQADTISAVSIQSAAKADEWRIAGVEALKGATFAQATLQLGAGAKDADSVRNLLTGQGGVAGLLFSAAQENERRGFLRVGTTWLNLKAGLKDSVWQIQGLDPKMDGVFAGGAEMLARMTRYILADPEATVPVAVGTRWMDRSRIGKVAGTVAGLAAIDLKGDGRMCLFVASDQGDQLFRPNEAGDTLENITAAAKLDSRSRRFAWIDMNRDGLTDLVTWNGSAIAVRLVNADGTFAAADPSRTFQLDGECLGLAAASVSGDGAPGVLVSTQGLPFLLGAAGKKTVVPAGDVVEKGSGEAAACIVADLDNDGFLDVLQPRKGGGLLWKGVAGGFAEPTRTPVCAQGNAARFALGDFDGDGFLDVFLSDRERNQLWENDGKAGFSGVIDQSGSLSYKPPAGVSDCMATDLNHDGRTDLALGYADTGFTYHFNRGYRCLGEEGELRLTGPRFPDGLESPGVRAMAAADFNGEGAHDLAVVLTDGSLYCYYNDLYDEPGVAVRLAKGVTGPVTVSAWQSSKYPYCIGTYAVCAHAPSRFFSARVRGECTLRYSMPGKPNRSKKVTVGDKVVEVIAGE